MPKYNKGREVGREKQWFFGGIQRHSKKAFMQPVDKRNASTLLPILQKFVEKGIFLYLISSYFFRKHYSF